MQGITEFNLFTFFSSNLNKLILKKSFEVRSYSPRGPSRPSFSAGFPGDLLSSLPERRNFYTN